MNNFLLVLLFMDVGPDALGLLDFQYDKFFF